MLLVGPMQSESEEKACAGLRDPGAGDRTG